MNQQQTIYVDIDNTIAGGFPFGRFYNTYWSLGLDSGLLDTLGDDVFFSLPCVAPYLSDEEELRWARYYASIDVASIGRRTPIHGSQAVLRGLAQRYRIKYISLRWAIDRNFAHLPERQAEIYQATVDWLRRHGYPNPSEVTLVGSFAKKMTHIGKDEAQKVWMIDDRYQDLLKVVGNVISKHGDAHGFVRRVREDITVIGFDAHEIACVTHGVRTIPLPSWKDCTPSVFDLETYQKGIEYVWKEK